VKLITEFAGHDRAFDLTTGAVMDLEQACGQVGIGAIYLRVARHEYFRNDIFQIIYRGLIGGGMDEIEAKRIVAERMDAEPLAKMVELALTILLAMMEGVQVADAAKSGDADGAPMDVGKILHSFVQAGIAPEQVRRMSYADFLNILRAAGRKPADEAPSEEEYKAILARFEDRK